MIRIINIKALRIKTKIINYSGWMALALLAKFKSAINLYKYNSVK